MRETKTLSTTLYRACTSIDSIMGIDMLSSSLLTGITPILFSLGAWGELMGGPPLRLDLKLPMERSIPIQPHRGNTDQSGNQIKICFIIVKSGGTVNELG